MRLLIDAYNLLHAPMPTILAGLNVSELCQALARTPWAAGGGSSQFREAVTVVCDGQPGVLGLLESPAAGVELIYSGHGRTADAVIIDRIESDSAPRRLLVVSTDHEIRRAASRRRCRSVPSEQFAHDLARALHHRPPRSVRPSPSAPVNDLDTRGWLKWFGLDPDSPDPDAMP